VIVKVVPKAGCNISLEKIDQGQRKKAETELLMRLFEHYIYVSLNKAA
jgi:hypothetical protein